MNRKQLNLSVPEGFHALLATRAEALGLSQSKLVQLAVERFDDASVEQRLVRVERTFDRLGQTNPALAKIWRDA